jgi:hypothetical protein
VQQPQRHLDSAGELFAVLFDQLRQDIFATHLDGPNPCEVVESGVTQPDVVRVHVEPAREQPLESNRDIAEAHRSVPVIEQRSGHDAHGVGEVDDPSIRRRAAPHFVGNLEHDRNCPQCLGASCAGGLLPTQPHRSGSSRRGAERPGLRFAAAAARSLPHRPPQPGPRWRSTLPPIRIGRQSDRSHRQPPSRVESIAQHELIDLYPVAQASDPSTNSGV